MATDPVIQQFEFDVETERKADERLASMGIRDPEDLGSGRVDVGLVAAHLNRVDPERDFLAMEEAKRNADWALQAGSPEQPGQPVAAPPPNAESPEAPTQAPLDPLGELQAKYEAAAAEATRMKEQYARESAKWGEERRRNAEARAKEQFGRGSVPQFDHRVPATQATSYDPRLIGDLDPNAPISRAEAASLYQSLAIAVGNQMSQREESIIETAKSLRGYDLTANDEADLLERYPSLAMLDRPTQIRAMRDLVSTVRQPAQPAVSAPVPKPVDMTALARAKHLTATTFIEPSSRGSAAETNAVTGVDSALAKKIAEYRAAMREKPGDPGSDFDQYNANRKAEKLLREINTLQRRRM